MPQETANTQRPRRWPAVLVPVAFAASILGALMFALWYQQRNPEPPLLIAGGAPGKPPDAVRRLLPVPMYKQWDPAWGDDLLGPTRDPMRFTGCTVCCVAMTFSSYGRATTPKELNDWLKSHGGYTRQGLLRWEKCEEFSGGRIALDYHGPAERARIDAALAAGRPAIVKVLLEGGVPHWVLVVGTEGGEYLVNDPLNESREPARLSAYGQYLYALRIFRRR